MGCEKSSLKSGFLGLRIDAHCNTPKQRTNRTRIGIVGSGCGIRVWCGLWDRVLESVLDRVVVSAASSTILVFCVTVYSCITCAVRIIHFVKNRGKATPCKLTLAVTQSLIFPIIIIIIIIIIIKNKEIC